jgi:ferrous iron transport protein A
LTPGARAKISEVRGDDAVSLRLLEMGVTPGVELCYVGSALLGDPLEIEIRGYRLSIRKAEAARVWVEPV